MKATSALLMLGAAAAVTSAEGSPCSDSMAATAATCLDGAQNPVCTDECMTTFTGLYATCAQEPDDVASQGTATMAMGAMTLCALGDCGPHMNNAEMLTKCGLDSMMGDDDDDDDGEDSVPDMDAMCTDECKAFFAEIAADCAEVDGMSDMVEGLSAMAGMCDNPCAGSIVPVMSGQKPELAGCFPDDDADPTADNCGAPCLSFFDEVEQNCAAETDEDFVEAAVGAGLMKMACSALAGGGATIPECATCSEVPTGSCKEIKDTAFEMMEEGNCLSTCTNDELETLMAFLVGAGMIDNKCVDPIMTELNAQEESSESSPGVVAGAVATAAAMLLL